MNGSIKRGKRPEDNFTIVSNDDIKQLSEVLDTYNYSVARGYYADGEEQLNEIIDIVQKLVDLMKAEDNESCHLNESVTCLKTMARLQTPKLS